ncbi:protein XRI1 isoform X2 [Diospyros lotus]|nr:protein XRI1 isoform X2 [Diospyros lotus]
MWDWHGEDYSLQKDTNLGASECLWDGVNNNEELPHMLDEATPVRACGDLAYHVAADENMKKGLQDCRETNSQVKRRRMLQFDNEVLDAPFCNEEMPSVFLKSKEKEDSLEEALSNMSQWVSGFAEDTSGPGYEGLDQSSEEWLADCFNDVEMQCCTDDMNVSGASDVQIDISEFYTTTPPEYEVTAAQKRSAQPCQNVVFRGRKSYMQTPRKLASSVAYPFAFIKPCGAHGDVTLKDINQRIRTPPSSKLKQSTEDPSAPYPTSAFSGKPVVGKTKIRTEGGKGSITIMRTRG